MNDKSKQKRGKKKLREGKKGDQKKKDGWEKKKREEMSVHHCIIADDRVWTRPNLNPLLIKPANSENWGMMSLWLFKMGRVLQFCLYFLSHPCF